MEEKTGNNEGAVSASSQEKSGGSRPLLIGIIAGVLVVNTIISFMLIKATKPKSEEQVAAQMHADSMQQATERMTHMGATTEEEPIEAVVNIAGTDGKRFLKVAIIFEFDEEEYAGLHEELIRRAPRFKNLLIDHLSRLTLDEVTEPDAKEKIRRDLVRLVNATLPPKTGEVREVFFTTYIIQ